MDKVFYNEASAAKLGWTPDWFGCKDHDENLVKAIRAWQKKAGITADGMCGPSTHRRIYNERLSNIGLSFNMIFLDPIGRRHNANKKTITPSSIARNAVWLFELAEIKNVAMISEIKNHLALCQ